MSDLRYPNETPEYREARDALLEEEKLLIEHVKALAEKRRALPPGGELAEDYRFVGADDRTLGDTITFSELFGDKETLLIYSYMFGPDWDHPCPSCTSLIDGFDRASISVTASTAFVVVAKASPQQLNDWAKRRAWTNIALVSAAANSYLTDYKCQDEGPDGKLWPVMHVFTRQDGKIRHFWGTEMMGNHVDTVWPYWNLMDFTPEGRPDLMLPPQDFRSEFLQKHYLSGE
jgi:predicted dithiol-disulfide oxidoreductase (DUF899 family)